MLGVANMKELAIVKTEQSKMDCRFYGNDRQMEIGANLPKVDGPNPASFPGQQRWDRPRPVTTNIPCKLNNHIHKGKAENQSGKKFTGILPKSRFFGQKWLINMLGVANMKELAIVKTEQSKMDCRFHGNDSQLEIGTNLPKVANLQVDGRHHFGFAGTM